MIIGMLIMPLEKIMSPFLSLIKRWIDSLDKSTIPSSINTQGIIKLPFTEKTKRKPPSHVHLRHLLFGRYPLNCAMFQLYFSGA